MRRSRALLPVLACGLFVACSSPRHPCPSAMTKGPWVQRVDETHATILWEATDNGCTEAEVAPEAPPSGDGATQPTLAMGTTVTTHVVTEYGQDLGLPLPDLPGTYYLHEISLSGLTPASCYRYQVAASGTDAVEAGIEEGRFCTMRPPGASFTFLAIGDTDPALGHTVPLLQETLPASLGTGDPDFTVHLGDLQYYSAIIETWSWWFQAMAPLLRAAPFFPTIGNHEFELGGAEYADYYGRLFVPASTEPTLRWYHFASGGVHFFALDTEDDPLVAGSPEVTWLTSALAAAAATAGFRFSVVTMHRPLYTLGDADPLVSARPVLEPLFKTYGVTLILAGHMHGYERFEVGPLTYVTCAGGGGLIGDVNMNVANYPADAPLRVAVSNHYSDCLYTVRPGLLSSTVIDQQGAVIDSFVKPVP